MLLALALALQSARPLDQPPDQTMMVEPIAMLIATFDANGDGTITHAEMTAGVARTFDRVDTDHKGSIGYIQYSDWALTWLGDRNALPSPFEVDGNHDNRITLPELEAEFDQTFARLDSDHDGVLTHAELLTIRASPVSGYGGGKHHRR